MKLSFLRRLDLFKRYRCPDCKQLVIRKRRNKMIAYLMLIPLIIWLGLYMTETSVVWKMFGFRSSIIISSDLQQLALNITKECNDFPDWEDCNYSTIALFVAENTTYRADSAIEEIFNFDEFPNTTLASGGDCDNRAILFISLIKSIEPHARTYIATQDSHVCAMVEVKYFNTAYYPKFYLCDSLDDYRWIYRV